MVVAEPPGGLPPVLHTGDARLDPAFYSGVPELVALRERGGVTLVLDTTYCDPAYTFPPQADVLRFVLEAVRAEAFNPRALYVFGSYTIGKERLFLEVARALGRKVYISAAKRRILDCLGLAPEYAALLTTDHLSTNLHALPLGKVTLAGMEELLGHYRGRYTSAVGFAPTGWTTTKTTTRAQPGRRLQRGALTLYSLAYSEHSSFTELMRFVGWLRPARIIPSVNNDSGGAKCRKMLELLSPALSGAPFFRAAPAAPPPAHAS